jgi:hypothetical protein
MLFTVSATVGAARLKNGIRGIWNVVKIETTDQSLNFMIRNIDLSKSSVEFTKSGNILISGKDTKTKYSVKGDKIILSEGIIKESRFEVKAGIKSDSLSANIPAGMMKQILLTVKDQYAKSGGDAFLVKMIENAAQTYSIEATVTLKRK